MVTKRRIDGLFHIRRIYGARPQLDSLLKRCKSLRPDLTFERISSTTKNTKNYNGPLERTFAEIWSTVIVGNESVLDISLKLSDAYSKKSNPLIPLVSCEKQCVPTTKNGSCVSIHECKTVKELVKNIHHVQMPDQALSLLRSQHLFYLVLLNTTPTEIQERLSISIYFVLHNEFLSLSRSKKPSSQKTDLLCRINILQAWLQRGLPVVGRFLAEYLPTWDGDEYFVEICKLLSFLPIVDINGT